MSKIIIVKSCSTCPYHKFEPYLLGVMGKEICRLEDKYPFDRTDIKRIKTFPRWCPLKEATNETVNMR